MKGRRADPSTAREQAFEILLRVERSGAYASILLEAAESRLRDAREGALLHEIVLGVLRQRAVLDHVLAGTASRAPARMDAEVRTALRIGVYNLLFLDRVPEFAAVDSAVELAKRARSPVAGRFANGVLRAIARQGRRLLPQSPEEGDATALALFHSHPRWWAERQIARLGWTRAGALMAANNRPAATTLRARREANEVEVLEARLAAAGVRARPGRFCEQALRVESGSLRASHVLAEGRAWVQDEASQLVPAMLGRDLGPRVADLCAAPGGKTMQLSETLGSGGTVVSVDRHAGRLRRLVGNLERIGISPLALQADLTADPPLVRRSFQQVLLDAPCSGTGTLRRHPEIRWRLRPEDPKLLAARQARLLENAAGLVARGGRLVYSVCSMEPEEGAPVIRQFLDRHPAFRIGDPRPALPPAARPLVGEDGFLRTSPDQGLDGFFAALLLRADA